MFHLILNDRGVLQVEGEQAANFLQGLLTNDVNKAGLMYSLFLTPQGKIISDIFILRITEHKFWMDVPRAQMVNLLNRFNLYKLRQQVKFTDISDEYHITVSSAQLESDYLEDPRNPQLGWRAVAKEVKGNTGNIHDYHFLRMQLSIPDFTIDLEPEKFFPAELGMNELNAIDYKKGCYVGQEVTARTHYRGTVRKALYQLNFINSPPYSYGEEIIHDGKVLGKMLGCIENRGLGLLKMELAANYTQQNVIVL